MSTQPPIPPENQICFCHGRPLAECPMFAPLLQEAQQGASPAGSGPATPPSAANKETTMPPKKKAGAAGAKKQPVHRRQFEKEVRIALEDKTERERLTKELLHKLRDFDALRIEAANVAAGYRDKLKDLKKEIDGTRDDLDVGLPTMRLVEETRNFNGSDKFPNGRLTIKDVETGVVYEDRELTDEDAQVPISDLPNGEEDEEKDDGDGEDDGRGD